MVLGGFEVKLGTKRPISAKLDATTEVALHVVQGWVQAKVFHEWVFHRWYFRCPTRGFVHVGV